jgi:ligand-binding sensor protein
VIGEGDKSEVKDVTNIGEFVRYCVEPAMQKRTKADKQKQEAEKKKAEEAKKNAEGAKNE